MVTCQFQEGGCFRKIPQSLITIFYHIQSRNRFEHILTNIYCCKNNHLCQGGRFTKVRPFFDEINIPFFEFPFVEQFDCVEEAVVPYFCRHGSKQFIRGKPMSKRLFTLIFYSDVHKHIVLLKGRSLFVIFLNVHFVSIEKTSGLIKRNIFFYNISIIKCNYKNLILLIVFVEI